MKIAFILPAIGKKKHRKYLKSWLMEPLTIAVLKRLTPEKYPCVFFDDRIEQIDYDTDADVIAITVETYTAKRAYEIAARFHRKGKTIVMGGYHTTLTPEDARPHADVLVRGNAEMIWAQVLSDIERGAYMNEYRGPNAIGYGQPDRSIYKDKQKKYLPVGLVEIGRGCHYDCSFCSIRVYYDRKYIHREIPDIIEEIKSLKHKIFFFVDDSIFSDKEFAKELFREVKKLHILWTTQVTLDIARDEEMLRLMRESGCVMIWAQVLSDIERGAYMNEYRGPNAIGYGQPDRSIYKDKQKKYLPVGLVEIGRGCHYDCSFCSIRVYYDRKYIHREIPDIIEEIKSLKHRIFFFVDDSIFSDKEFAKELFREVKKLHILWTTQVTLDIARDEEMLRLMRESGCVMILIGFESIDPVNLKQMNKEWSVKLGERDELVERIHRNGISIYASFVFGFDHDNEESFRQNLEFCEKHAFFITAFNHLLAFPGTETYRSFQEDGRLLSDKWWLQDGYTFGTISYKPRQLTPEQLRSLCREYKRKFFTFRSISRRGKVLRSRTGSRYVRFVYLAMNILFHFEVDKRFGIPLGCNLDRKNTSAARGKPASVPAGKPADVPTGKSHEI